MATDGIDISTAEQKQAKPTFREAAEEWYQRKIDAGRARSTTRQMRMYLDRDILPVIGDKPLNEITRAKCAGIQEAIEDRGAFNIVKKIREWISNIFSMAIAQGKCELNPATELRHIAAQGPARRNYPHLIEGELPGFLQALRKSPAGVVTLMATWMVLRTASRPGMVRYAKWSEIDFDNALWTIPADKMKARRDIWCRWPRRRSTISVICRRSPAGAAGCFPAAVV
ncbi:tyrosine-type recombinase/integrase [Kushneria sinocarnis]|uniref:tyrosine-type recombinase/integrase n=1 Tax=Kushneria sinocarnis TaxID=595502 RepID=UPI001B86F9B0|nr:hypothetical protein [Kushneria sinocarnis]